MRRFVGEAAGRGVRREINNQKRRKRTPWCVQIRVNAELTYESAATCTESTATPADRAEKTKEILGAAAARAEMRARRGAEVSKQTPFSFSAFPNRSARSNRRASVYSCFTRIGAEPRRLNANAAAD